jgi:hypothetical protein
MRCRLQVLTITVPAEQVAAAQQMVLECLSARAQLTYSVGGTIKLELPSSEVSLLLQQLTQSCVHHESTQDFPMSFTVFQVLDHAVDLSLISVKLAINA